MSNPDNDAFARLTFNEVERYARDEFEKEIVLKSYAIGYTVAFFTVYCAAAVLAWVLPGAHSLWALAPICGLVIAELVSSNWMKQHVPRPGTLRSWPGIILMMVPTIALFAGIWFSTREVHGSFFAGNVISGAIVGACAAFLLGPLFAKRRHERDEKRLNSQLED